MATLAEAFHDFVLLDPAVTALISQRLHWNKVPDTPGKPFVKGQTIVDPPTYHQQGLGPSKATLQLDIYGDSPASVDNTFEALKRRCSGYRGNIGGYDVRIFVTNQTDSWTEDMRLWHRMLELEVGYVS